MFEGLHLNISEGRPIDDQCVTLLNDQDVFHGKMGIRLMLAENKVAAEDVGTAPCLRFHIGSSGLSIVMATIT